MDPENKERDGVYFRIVRGDVWQPVCFSDMTHEERAEALKDADIGYLERLLNIIADTLYEL